jgi:hypothetical protein
MAPISEKMYCSATLEKLNELIEFVEECVDRFGLETKKKFGLLVRVSSLLKRWTLGTHQGSVVPNTSNLI